MNDDLTDDEILADLPKRKPVKKPAPVDARRMHAEEHALAKDVSEYCGEPKLFARYLGVILRIGLPAAYRIFSELKQSPKAKSRAAIFMYQAKKKR